MYMILRELDPAGISMNWKHLGILCACTVLVFSVCGVMAVSGTVKIMPLGDSITKGGVSTPEEAAIPTYRYWLWKDLTENGYDVDFVGSWKAPNFTSFSFDQDNEGHGGYSTDEILHGVPDDEWENGYLSQWIQSYDYDVVLLMIGTNDVIRGVPTNDTVTNIKKIITVVRQKNPRVTVFLATLPPTGIYRQGLITLNQKIPGIVEEMDTTESRVFLVEQYYGYNAQTDNQPTGYVHPNNDGAQKLANNWLEALKAYLGGAVPTVIPTTIPTTVPTTIPTTIPTTVPTTILTTIPTTAPTTSVTTAITTLPTTSRFGSKRYTIGELKGSTRGGSSSSSGSSGSGSNSRRLSPDDTANGTTPPTKMFVRWYPAARWALGMK
jgi:lysophospholipase L1-like esterase